MYKDILLKKDSGFSVCGGVLVPGDMGVYRLKMDMGEDASHFSAMAICQETGGYSGNYSHNGNVIYCTLTNSMYSSRGYITIRFVVSDGERVLTAKEVVFEVTAPNNGDELAADEGNDVEKILTAVQKAESAASEIDSKLEEVYSSNDDLRAEVYQMLGSIDGGTV